VAAAAVFAGWAISAPPASLMAAVCFDQEASKTLGNSAKTLCTRRVYSIYIRPGTPNLKNRQTVKLRQTVKFSSEFRREFRSTV
jgi:hypothetical protein